jgi:hypothetical protein
MGASPERNSAVNSQAGVETPPPPSRSTSSGTSSQPESLEGRTQSRVVRQLAEIGYKVRLVHRVLHHISHHRLFDGHPGKDSWIEDFGTGSYIITLRDVNKCASWKMKRLPLERLLALTRRDYWLRIPPSAFCQEKSHWLLGPRELRPKT